MGKEKRGKKMNNRLLYTFITLGIMVLVLAGVYAYNSGADPSTFGHSASEIDFSEAIDGQLNINGPLHVNKIRSQKYCNENGDNCFYVIDEGVLIGTHKIDYLGYDVSRSWMKDGDDLMVKGGISTGSLVSDGQIISYSGLFVDGRATIGATDRTDMQWLKGSNHPADGPYYTVGYKIENSDWANDNDLLVDGRISGNYLYIDKEIWNQKYCDENGDYCFTARDIMELERDNPF
jgi:hypothetical protein